MGAIEAALRTRIRQLTAQVEELEETVRQLRAVTFNSEWTPPAALGLTEREAAVVAFLLGRDRLCTKNAIMDAIYSLAPETDEPMEKIVDVFVCKARRKLKPHGIAIETVWGRGYQMPADSKARLRAMERKAA